MEYKSQIMGSESLALVECHSQKFTIANFVSGLVLANVLKNLLKADRIEARLLKAFSYLCHCQYTCVCLVKVPEGFPQDFSVFILCHVAH